MMKNKTLIAVGISAAMGFTAANVSAAALTLTFSNNTNTTPDYIDLGNVVGGSFVNLADNNFAANAEFRVLIPPGSSGVTDINDGHKDVMSGGEQWNFDDAGDWTSVSASLQNKNSGVTVGTDPALNQAPVTLGVTGYPLCAAANTCDAIQNGADFLGAGLFTMLAPTVGSEIANAVGSNGTISIDSASTFSIFMPVVYTQWANGTYVIGHGGGKNALLDWTTAPGVTLEGTMLTGNTTDGGTFILRGQYSMTRGEVTVGGFLNNTVEWELTGTLGPTAVVPVPAAVWLFGSGLLGLVGVARRKKAT